jgi:hypothetical protein
MANTLLTIDKITREALRIFRNNVVIPKLVMRQYDDEFGNRGAKIGSTLRVRVPNQYTVGTGRTITPQDTIENKVSLTVATQKHVPMSFFSDELALSLDDFSERIIAPAVRRLASEVDYDLLTQFYQGTSNAVGTPGTVPSTLLTYLNAGVKLSDGATPRDNQRHIVINPLMEATIVDALKGLFHSSDQIEEQYEEGMMGRTAGFNWWMDQNVNTHTVGPLGGTPLVNGAHSSSGTDPYAAFTVATDGWTAAAAARLKKGDVLTFATVYQVNPETKKSTGVLQQFVVQADFSSSGTGTGDISVKPSPIFTGAQQTVTSVTNTIPDNAAITVLGAASTATPTGMAFHKESAIFVAADLELPRGTDQAYRARMDNMSMRIISDFDTINDRMLTRVDVLYGFVVARPEFACRIQS